MIKNLFLTICGALIMFSCGSGASNDALFDVDWTLETVKAAEGNEKLTPIEGKAPTLNINKETSAVSGFAGCNRLTSKATIDGNKINFGGVAMTRMFCEEGMDIEFALSKALESVDKFEIKSDKLILKSGETVVAEYKK